MRLKPSAILLSSRLHQAHLQNLAQGCCFGTKLLHLRKKFRGHARQALKVAIEMALVSEPAGDRHL